MRWTLDLSMAWPEDGLVAGYRSCNEGQRWRGHKFKRRLEQRRQSGLGKGSPLLSPLQHQVQPALYIPIPDDRLHIAQHSGRTHAHAQDSRKRINNVLSLGTFLLNEDRMSRKDKGLGKLQRQIGIGKIIAGTLTRTS